MEGTWDVPDVDEARIRQIHTLSDDQVVEVVIAIRAYLDEQRARLKEQRIDRDEQRAVQTRLCSESFGLIAGITSLITSRGGSWFKQHGCNVLATLAWSNPESSRRIAMAPRIWDAIADILSISDPYMISAQEQGALVIGNCSANCPFVSQIVSRHQGLLNGLSDILNCDYGGRQNTTRTKETALLAIKNAAAISQEAAHLIVQHETLLHTIKRLATGSVESLRGMAMGAINAFSRSANAVECLTRASVFEDVILPLLDQHDDGGELDDQAAERNVMTITSAAVNMGVARGTNILIIKRWISSTQGQQSISNLVKCLSLSLADSRWDAVTFSPFSVILPLYNILKTCPSASKALLQSEFLDLVCEVVSQFKNMAQCVEAMELSISICAIMCELEGEECMRGLRRRGLLGKLWDVCQEITERLVPEFSEHLSDEGASRLEVRIKNLLVDIQCLSDKLAAAPLALCMALSSGGHYVSSGPIIQLAALDRDTMSMICRYAFYDV